MAGDLNRSIRIYLDNSQAMTSATELEAKMKSLEKELNDLEKAGKGDTEQALKKQKVLKGLGKKYEEYKHHVAETERVLKNLSGSTYKQLINAKKELVRQLQQTERGTDLYNQRLKVLNSLNKEISLSNREMRGELGSKSSFWGRAADGVNRYMGVFATGVAAITGVTMALSKFRDEKDKLESSSAGLKALTGLGDEEVGQLMDAAKRLSTSVTVDGVRIKQSALEINDAFSVVGSQRPELLKSAAAMEAVTQDAMYLSIAARSELDPAVRALTTVMNQMNLSADESRRIINALAAGSQAGAADIPYLTAAFEKSGTTAALMGIELEQLVGAIEAVAPRFSEASVAGNGLDKVLLKMKESGMGYKDGQFDLNRALEELASRFAKGESSAKIFGVEHAKMAEVLVQGRADIERYTEAVTDTDKAIEQATINSNTNEAKRAQARNELTLIGVELMQTLNPAITSVMNQTVSWTGKLVKLLKWLSDNKEEVLLVAGAVSTYVAWQNKAIIVDKLRVLWNDKIVGGMKRLWATLLANPYAAAGAAVLAFVVYLRSMNKELDSATIKQRALEKINVTAKKSIAEQTVALDNLLRVARDEAISQGRRLEALKKIQEISPKYLGSLSLEAINTDKAKAAVDRYRASILELAKAQAAKNRLVEIEEEKNRLDNDPEAFQEEISQFEKLRIGLNNVIDPAHAEQLMQQSVANARNSIKKQKDALEAESAELVKIVQKNLEVLDGSGSTDEDPDPDPEVPPSGDDPLKAKLAAVEAQIESERMLLKQSYLDKEMDRLAYNKRMEGLELELLQRKMQIAGLDEETQRKVMDKILDYKIKMMEQLRGIEVGGLTDMLKDKSKLTEKDIKQLGSELLEKKELNEKDAEEQYAKMLENAEKMQETAKAFGSEIGTMIGGAISGNSDLVKDGLVTIINMGLDALKIQAQMAVAGATMQSLAQPDSVATFGVTGFARAAILVGLIEVAFAGVKAVVGSLVDKIGSSNSERGMRNAESPKTGSYVAHGFASGGYTGDGPVMGVAGPAHFGEYYVPAWQLADSVSMNHVRALESIRTSSSNSELGMRNAELASAVAVSPSGGMDDRLLLEVRDLLRRLYMEGVDATVVYSEIEKKRKTLEKAKNIGKK